MENKVSKDKIPFNCEICEIYNLSGCYFNHDCLMEECILNKENAEIKKLQKQIKKLKQEIASLYKQNTELFKASFRLW